MKPTATDAQPCRWGGAVCLLRRFAEAALALSLLGMVLAVFLNVVLRYFFNTGLAVSEELSRLLFIWLVCIGAVLAMAEDKHLGFDMVTRRLRGRSAMLCRWLARVLIALALYHLIQGAWQQVLAGLGSYSPVMNYPLALAAAGILVMGVAMAILLVAQCLGNPGGRGSVQRSMSSQE
ncbi:TRAP transporter small permease [Tepidimonas taiwanensis]|uniref:TRAP transporter small permease n=1 Tax=Tepidimonas taiwanensis TaxID=307486 RepID=UPI000733FBEF|nr:TRAP transporter small permease [Tepidimonas taiwanensis]